jgi:type II secretory pathway component GspD/PulD (secretin)
VPGIGHLFQHTNARSIKSELVILLRPYVIDGGQSWNALLNRSDLRVKDLNGGRRN